MPGGRLAEFAGSKRVFGWTMGGVRGHRDDGRVYHTSFSNIDKGLTLGNRGWHDHR